MIGDLIAGAVAAERRRPLARRRRILGRILAAAQDCGRWDCRHETLMAADWKLVVEQWLESTERAPRAAREGWSARAPIGGCWDPQRIVRWQRRFLAPNHLVEVAAGRAHHLPGAAEWGRAAVCCVDMTSPSCEADRAGARRPVSGVAAEARYARASAIAVAESTQKGIVDFRS